jgi:hypothetical protein
MSLTTPPTSLLLLSSNQSVNQMEVEWWMPCFVVVVDIKKKKTNLLTICYY